MYNLDDSQIEALFSAAERALCGLRVPLVPGEYDLHRMVGEALSAAGLEAIHEARIAPRCRIDFLMDGLGIEIKKGSVSAAALRAQVGRYLSSDALSAILLVTTRGVDLPCELCGKKIRVFGLNRLWGVAL